MEPERERKIYILYEVNCCSSLINYYQACIVRRACMKGEKYEVSRKEQE
jgi:hypothetical protein